MNTYILTLKAILFFDDLKLLQARSLDSKLAVCMFYLAAHRFVARVQSSICTTYRKCLLESIMPLLTPKSGIRTGIICKKILCCMRDSSCRWLNVENAKIFRSMLNIFGFSHMKKIV